ncbi:MAG: hypothetical protein ACR2IA_02335 [Pyrinomonadaceae bacterium]
MKNTLFNFSMILALTLSFGVFAFAQDTTTTTTTVTKKEVVANPDGTYTVIEYPVGKEVTIELTPNNIQGAKGWAKVMRTDDGTTVALDLSGLPADSKEYYVYAVDNAGVVTLLGPATIENGMSKTTFTTPMSQFMLVLSPTGELKAIEKDSSVMFRSAVPTGYAIVPVGNRVEPDGDELKEEQNAVSMEVASTYSIPLLGVPAFEKGTTEISIKFSGDLAGLKGKAYIDPRTDGSTRVKMRFDDMKMAPKNKRFVLWASAADGSYTKLGQVINTGKRQEAEVRSETALKDFGLFVTMEETDVEKPTSKIYSVFSIK